MTSHEEADEQSPPRWAGDPRCSVGLSGCHVRGGACRVGCRGGGETVGSGGVPGSGGAAATASFRRFRRTAASSPSTRTQSNLVAGDTDRLGDMFVWDRVSGITQRVSVSSREVQGNRNGDRSASISAGGRYVAFSSRSSNLVRGDTNEATDVFWCGGRDYPTGLGEQSRTPVRSDHSQNPGDLAARALHSLLLGGVQPGARRHESDRRRVRAERAGRDHPAGVGEQSRGSGRRRAGRPAISYGGRSVAFTSNASNLMHVTEPQLRRLCARPTRWGDPPGVGEQHRARRPGRASPITRSGRYVGLLGSAEPELRGHTTFNSDVYLHDRATGTTTQYHSRQPPRPGQ